MYKRFFTLVRLLILSSCILFFSNPIYAEQQYTPIQGILASPQLHQNKTVTIYGRITYAQAQPQGLLAGYYKIQDNTGEIVIWTRELPPIQKEFIVTGTVTWDPSISQAVIQEQSRSIPGEWGLNNIGESPLVILGLVILLFSIIGILIVIYMQQKAKQAEEERMRQEQREKERMDIEREKLRIQQKQREEVSKPKSAPERKTHIGFHVGSLKVIKGTDSGKEYAVHAPKTAIGASSDNDVLAGTTDKLVSSKHAVISASADGICTIRDLDSTNGTRIKRRDKELPITQDVLKDGDVIIIGNSFLEFHLSKSSSEDKQTIIAPKSISEKETYIPTPLSREKETMIFTGAKLIIQGGSTDGKSFSIVKMSTSIGRRENKDIVINDETVSRDHASLSMEGDKFVLKNESKAGTKVNGQNIESIELKHGDIIQMGSIRMVFNKEA